MAAVWKTALNGEEGTVLLTFQTSPSVVGYCALPDVASLTGRAYRVFIALSLSMAMAIVATFSLAVSGWTVLTGAAVVLIVLNALWILGGVVLFLLRLHAPKDLDVSPPARWQSSSKTAVLITLCGEDPTRLPSYLTRFTASSPRGGLAPQTQVFVISDTSGDAAVANKDAALADLIAAGDIMYHRQAENTDKKLGNIAGWSDLFGDACAYMLVKDADSKMGAESVRRLIWQRDQRPNTVLLQAAIPLVPSLTRFGRMSSRLSDTPPFGDTKLNHDFSEAAWIRPARWGMELDPAMRSSARNAPQSMGTFFRRDRRWSQGYLEHMRLLTGAGLQPLSRLHLVTGIFRYLSAPIWLVLLVLLSLGSVEASIFWCVALVALVLLVAKPYVFTDLLPYIRTWRRWAVILRAFVSKFAVSVPVGPLISLRNAWAVGNVALGDDCGWKSSRRLQWQLTAGWQAAGLGVALLGFTLTGGPVSTLWVSLIFVPLITAPVLIPVLNGTPQ